MGDYRILGWQNEAGLTNYPLASSFDVQDLIVDASFVQFDNFVPKLTRLLVTPEALELTILFDAGEVTGILSFEQYDSGERYLRYTGAGRYLGCVTIGVGVSQLRTEYIGQQLSRDIPFIATTVRSIPSGDAVYTLDSRYGNIVFGALSDIEDTYTEIGGIVYKTSAGGNTMFYNINKNRKTFTFNAVGNHHIPENDIRPLKKINLVTPVDNNLYVQSNDIIKFNSINNQNLQVYLVGSSSGAAIAPTLAS